MTINLRADGVVRQPEDFTTEIVDGDARFSARVACNICGGTVFEPGQFEQLYNSEELCKKAAEAHRCKGPATSDPSIVRSGGKCAVENFMVLVPANNHPDGGKSWAVVCVLCKQTVFAPGHFAVRHEELELKQKAAEFHWCRALSAFKAPALLPDADRIDLAMEAIGAHMGLSGPLPLASFETYPGRVTWLKIVDRLVERLAKLGYVDLLLAAEEGAEKQTPEGMSGMVKETAALGGDRTPLGEAPQFESRLLEALERIHKVGDALYSELKSSTDLIVKVVDQAMEDSTQAIQSLTGINASLVLLAGDDMQLDRLNIAIRHLEEQLRVNGKGR